MTEKFEWRMRLCQVELEFLNLILNEVADVTQQKINELREEKRLTKHNSREKYNIAKYAWYDQRYRLWGTEMLLHRFSGVLSGGKPKTSRIALMSMKNVLDKSEEEETEK